MKNSKFLTVLIIISSIITFSFGKEKKEEKKTNKEEITVPIEKKINEKEFSKINIKKKKKKEVEIEVK